MRKITGTGRCRETRRALSPARRSPLPFGLWRAVSTRAPRRLRKFAGFEGAASLGEETDNPRRVIPRAIAAAWLVVGLGAVLLVPGLARRIGTNLADREGLQVEECSETRE